MSRARASRVAARAAILFVLLLTSIIPVSAAYNVQFTVASSPFVVTVGLPVAYPVTVTNGGGNTLNHVTVFGQLDPAFTFLPQLTVPDAFCSDTEPRCDFDQVRPGQPAPQAIFYYAAPATVSDPVNGDTYNFTGLARVSQGSNDDQNPGNSDSFTSPPVVTKVVPTSPNLVSGHSVPGIRTFTTGGLDCALLGLPANCEAGTVALGSGNPHGTRVTVPSNAEVTVADLPPLLPNMAPNPAVACPTAIAATCFGWGSSLSVANGATIPGGIRVTMRWDLSELPSGMTDKKLRVAHLLTATTFEQVTGKCSFNQAGVPTNMPCFEVAPFKLADKDIQATFWLASNRVSRGY